MPLGLLVELGGGYDKFSGGREFIDIQGLWLGRGSKMGVQKLILIMALKVVLGLGIYPEKPGSPI